MAKLLARILTLFLQERMEDSDTTDGAPVVAGSSMADKEEGRR